MHYICDLLLESLSHTMGGFVRSKSLLTPKNWAYFNSYGTLYRRELRNVVCKKDILCGEIYGMHSKSDLYALLHNNKKINKFYFGACCYNVITVIWAL